MICGAVTLVYVNTTLLPYIGQRVQTYAPWLPNPAQYNFLILGVTLLLMMRFRPQGFLPNRQREAELSVGGLMAADIEMGIPPDVDNVSVAPPGQDGTGSDARTPEVPNEADDR